MISGAFLCRARGAGDESARHRKCRTARRRRFFERFDLANMDRKKEHSFHATCARGFEPYLRSELCALGVRSASECGGGVQFRATFCEAMKICLWSRIANKVEALLGDCYAASDASIYELGRGIDLDPWFSPDKTFCVHAHSSDSKFKNALFLSLKVKDGIADRMREQWGRRSSIDTAHPDISLSLTVVQSRARLYIELQGDGLSMRGYRRRGLSAPIRETLGASMIAASQWDGKGLFCDPMCGSGTIAIEAAMIATQTAPGIQRRFGFEKLPFFGDFEQTWRQMRQEARETARMGRKNFCGEIVARDIDGEATELARNNAQTACLDGCIRFERGSVLDYAAERACIVTNPPYGERISVSGYDLDEFYFQFGRKLRSFGESTLTVISSAELLKKNMHMRPSQRISTFNGPLACEVARYALGKGRRDGEE